jgi:hypothetical protein
MAGSKINDYGVGDVNATSIMETLDAQRIGFHSLTLTEFDTTTKPAIAAGSKVEINGALFKFDAEEAISGAPADGTVYVLLSTLGDSVTASFTATAPTWSDSKQGFYGTGGNANYRYANFKMTKSGANYSEKAMLPLSKTVNFSVDESGDVECNDIDCNDISGVDTVLSGTLDIAGMLTESIAAEGYIKIGTLYIQWGNIPGGALPITETFPTAFPTACFSVTISGGKDSASGDPCYVTAIGTNNFTFDSTASNNLDETLYYIAIGN